MKRYALIRGARDLEELVAYLPANYHVIGTAIERTEQFSSVHRDGSAKTDRRVYVVGGEDNAGWTMDAYLLPRLASGSIIGEEIDLSHPVMKVVPE